MRFRLLALLALLTTLVACRSRVIYFNTGSAKDIPFETALKDLSEVLPSAELILCTAPRAKLGRLHVTNWEIGESQTVLTPIRGAALVLPYANVSHTLVIARRGWYTLLVYPKSGRYGSKVALFQFYWRWKPSVQRAALAIEALALYASDGLNREAPVEEEPVEEKPPVVKDVPKVDKPLWVKESGFQVVVPRGVLPGDQKLSVQALEGVPASVNTSQKLVSNAWTLGVPRQTFSKPVTLTLAFDKSKMAMNAKASDIYPIVAAGGRYERLTATKVDLQKGTVKFKVTRNFPLVNTSGHHPSDRREYFALATDTDAAVRLEKSPTSEFWCAKSAEAKARKSIESIRETLKLLSDKVGGPKVVRIHFVPLKTGVRAQAASGDTIELSSELDDPAAVSLIAHEYFHLVQQQKKLANFGTGGRVIPSEFIYDSEWMDEATAEYMAYRLVPNEAQLSSAVSLLDNKLTYRSLFDFDSASSAFIFFSFLERYFDVEALIAGYYDAFLKDGLLDPAEVLNKVFLIQKDKDGKTFPLRQRYSHFLLQYNWLKQFDPLAKHVNSDRLGKPGEITTPAVHLVTGRLPAIDGGDRKTSIHFDPVSGARFSIVKAYQIANDCAEDESGALTLSVKLDSRQAANSDDVMLVVFPFTAKKMLDPIIGNPKNPVVVKTWEKHEKVLVWLVDASAKGYNEISLTASMNAVKKEKKQGVNLEIQTEFPKHPGLVQASLRMTIAEAPDLGINPDDYKVFREKGYYPWLLKIEYDGMTVWRTVDVFATPGSKIEMLPKVPVRRTGTYPVKVTIYTGGQESPVLKYEGELNIGEPGERPDLPDEALKLAAERIEEAKREEREAFRRMSVADHADEKIRWAERWVMAHAAVVRAQNEHKTSLYQVQNRKALLAEVDKRLEKVGTNYVDLWNGGGVVAGKFYLLVDHGDIEEADELLKLVEAGLAKCQDKDKIQVATRQMGRMYRRLAEAYATMRFDADKASAVLKRWSALRPGDEIRIDLEYVNKVRGFFNPAAFK